MSKSRLAARRAELIHRCAEQRTSLAYELDALKPSNALGQLAANRKLVLGVLGAGLGLALTRRTRLASIAGSAMSAWRTVRNLRGMLGGPM